MAPCMNLQIDKLADEFRISFYDGKPPTTWKDAGELTKNNWRRVARTSLGKRHQKLEKVAI